MRRMPNEEQSSRSGTGHLVPRILILSYWLGAAGMIGISVIYALSTRFDVSYSAHLPIGNGKCIVSADQGIARVLLSFSSACPWGARGLSFNDSGPRFLFRPHYFCATTRTASFSYHELNFPLWLPLGLFLFLLLWPAIVRRNVRPGEWALREARIRKRAIVICILLVPLSLVIHGLILYWFFVAGLRAEVSLNWWFCALTVFPSFVLVLLVYRRLAFKRVDLVPVRCGQCGYDLTGNVSGRCPECGQKATSYKFELPPRELADAEIPGGPSGIGKDNSASPPKRKRL